MLSLVLFALTFIALVILATTSMIRIVQPPGNHRRNPAKSPNRFVLAVFIGLFTGVVTTGAAELGNLVGRPDGTVVENPAALGAAIGGGVFVLCLILALRDLPRSSDRRDRRLTLTYRKHLNPSEAAFPHLATHERHELQPAPVPVLNTVVGAALILVGASMGLFDIVACVEQAGELFGFAHSPSSTQPTVGTEIFLLLFLIPSVLLIRYGAQLANTPDARWRRGRVTATMLPAVESEPRRTDGSHSHAHRRRHHR